MGGSPQLRLLLPSGKGGRENPKKWVEPHDDTPLGREQPQSVPQCAHMEGTRGALLAGHRALDMELPAACLTVGVVLLTHGLCRALTVAVLFTVVLLLAQVLLGRACRDVTRHSRSACSG